MERYDVAVVGGGPAGVAAALAAAGEGARTLLCERDPELGGNVTRALVHTICGLYLAPQGDAPEPRWAHPGLPRRVAQALQRGGGAGAPERAGRVFYLPTHPPRIAELFAALCEQADSLDVRLRCELVRAELARDERTFSELELERAGERERAQCSVLIDASGDGVTSRAGAAFSASPPAELQHPSYIFRLRGVSGEALAGFERLKLSAAVAGAARRGALAPGADSVVVRPGPIAGLAHLTLGVPKPADAPYDPLDPVQRRGLERQARLHARSIVRFLRATRPEFRDAELDAWPARLGVRESRRLRGQVVISESDVLEGRRREDEVALSTWPIELWHEHRRAEFRYPKGPASVPLGALVSASHPRLGFAGRCLSATHEAHGALRVIGTAMAAGEAIGAAAALAARGGTALTAVEPARVRACIEAGCR